MAASPSPHKVVTGAASPISSFAEHPVSALAAAAAMMERFSAGDSLDCAVPAVLAMLAQETGAREVAVWMVSPGGWERAWSVGEPLTTADGIVTAHEQPGGALPGQLVARLATSERSFGALVLVPAGPLGADASLLFGATARLLVLQLAHAAQERQLEAEVAVRMQQIDRERRFNERIIDALPVGLYVVDRDYRVAAWNRKRETGTQGIARADAIGQPVFDVLHRQPREALQRELDAVFVSGALHTMQVESVATGDRRTYRLSRIPMRTDDDGITHVVTIGEDITLWREAQDRVAQAEKLAAMGQLAAGVMHEINNPLATIAACAESAHARLRDLMGAGVPVTEGTADLLVTIGREVHRCGRIVDGLLDFSHPKPRVRERVDLDAVLDRTLGLLAHHARFKSLAVSTAFHRGLPVLEAADEDRLVQVFMTLLLNAMDAVSEGGGIRIRTGPGDAGADCVVAEITDEGRGIPPSELSRIFEPFYTTKPAGHGTGLGLSICWRIAQEHGGRIEVESTLGQGSTFRVVLPVTAP